MLRRSPRAVLLWTAAAIVAVSTAAYVADTLVSLRHQDEAFGRVHTVVVASRDLALGRRVRTTDLADRKVRGEPEEPGALTDRADAVGRVVTVPLLRGAVVSRRHLVARQRDGRDGTVPDGLRAMRVIIEGGVRPRPGDPVDLYATFDPQTVAADVEPTLTVAHAVPVIAVDRDDPGEHGAAIGVTVLVSPDEAKRLAFAGAVGTLAIAVAPPEAAAAP
ncbi:MAG: Flp pilus assembly protein CpaB [Acidimicrobiia bacterium]